MFAHWVFDLMYVQRPVNRVLSFSVAVTDIMGGTWQKMIVYIVGVGKFCVKRPSRLLRKFGKASLKELVV